MAEITTKGKICHINLEPAENGSELEFTEKMKRPGAGEYDNMEYNHRKLIFTDEQEEEAFETFKVLKKAQRDQMRREKESASVSVVRER